MDNLITYYIVAGSIVLIGLIAVLLAFIEKDKKLPLVFLTMGILWLGFYIGVLWYKMGHAPMKTLGETRLWYAFFLLFIGSILYLRWEYKWILLFSVLMTDLFLIFNIIYPENFDTSLMPALQSYWFVPHVIVYIFAYSMMSIATLFSFKGLYQMRKKRWNTQNLNIIDNLVYIGFAFLTFGIIFGAMWAKEAWGHYWSFDPKETWALITWLMYLLYLHYRKFKNQNDRITLIILIIAFLMLLTCWFGVNYLPAAAKSIHVY
ncbi:MAG TPA: cytochrome c biogenesis protein CcsA [Bacteroidales bacterium]|jgi:cytochrome c-type biogenesis protein CcsB|nr:cytochrome c biogenesis protein CcsA [Bacteroidales bacterium]